MFLYKLTDLISLIYTSKSKRSLGREKRYPNRGIENRKRMEKLEEKKNLIFSHVCFGWEDGKLLGFCHVLLS